MKRKQPNENDQLDLIVDAQEQLDNQTTQSLEFFKLSRDVLSELQQNELKRLIVKYGRNHARVQKLETKMVQTSNVSRAVDVRLDILNNQAEPLPKDGWRLQGYVFTPSGESLPGLTATIAIKDEKKEVTRSKITDGYLSSTTSANGFYSITITSEDLKKILQHTLYLIVLDHRNHVIYTSKNRLNPIPGEIDFHDAVIAIAQEPDRTKKAKERGKRK